MVRAHMARGAFEDPMAVSSASGWKSLFWFAFGMAGVGFAAWVYLDPYMKMQRSIGSRLAEVATERGAASMALAERERLKNDLARFSASEKEKTEGDARRKATVESLATALKTGLEELGGTLMADGTVLQISFGA